MAQGFRIQGSFGFRNIQLVKTEEHSLGIGSYGAVYRAKCDQLVCAAKVLHPILFQTRDPAAHRIVQRFQREIDFLRGLRHPNVIQYLGSCPDPESGLPVLFMELMDDNLTSFLERPGADAPPLPLHVQVDIGHDVAQALCHLHRHEILHRDLSSNNVLLIGRRQVKVTDFGMAKLLGEDPRLTPTYCPGTNGYMSPEALAEPPLYTTKLDIFSCGVLLIQLITRQFPNPGPRTCTVQVSNDHRFPSGQALIVVPELERRKGHLDVIPPTHPLLMVALDCLKDKEDPRPTAEQLCSCLIGLKESHAYQDSLQQSPEEMAVVAAPVRDHELEQQLRETESRVEDLTQEVQQLQLQKDELDQEKSGEIEHIQRQLQNTDREKEQQLQASQQVVATLQQRAVQKDAELQVRQQVVAALQQRAEQKDAELQANVELLQEKEGEIQELQQRLGDRERRRMAADPLRLEWEYGPITPSETYGELVALKGGIVYLCDGVSGYKLLEFNSETREWKALQIGSSSNNRCFSLAVVNGQLTAIGGECQGTATKTLHILKYDFSYEWSRGPFPDMTNYHNNPAVVTTDTSLIVAGGWGPDKKKAPVEVMNTQTLNWSTVASLPHPLYQATATICGSRLYLGGGYVKGVATKSVLMCEVSDLLQSRLPSLATRLGPFRSRQVWKEICQLPVVKSSLITLQSQLLAVGGGATLSDHTSEVMQYDTTTNSWNVISRMNKKRYACFAAVLPDDRVMVCGGYTPSGGTDSVEIAYISTR